MQKISLKAARINANLTQKEAAEKAGCSDMTIVHYENGTRSPRIDILQKLLKVYGITAEQLDLFD